MVKVHGKFHPLFSLMFIFGVIGLYSWANLGQDPAEVSAQMETLMKEPAMKWGLWLMQGGASLFIFVVVPLVVLKVNGTMIRETFFIGTKNEIISSNGNYTGEDAISESKESNKISYHLTSFLLVLVFVILSMPFNGWIAELNSMIPFPDKIVQMEQSMGELTKSLTNFSGIPELLIGFIVIAVIAGVGEEFMFRGVLQNLFKSLFKNKHVAIWVTAFIFSAIHMQFLGFFPRMFLGALFGYIYVWSGNLTLAMFGHIVNNGFAVVMMHLYNTKVITFDLDSEETMPLTAIIGSFVITVWLLWTLRNHLVKNNPNRAIK